MQPWIEHLGTSNDTEARMRCDGTNLWFECRKVGESKWEKIARRVNQQWVSVKKGAKVTFKDEFVLISKADMKSDDVSEPVNTLVQLVMKYGMAEVLTSLAGVAEIVARNEPTERTITEATWLRNQLLLAAEHTKRFNEGKPSAEGLAGQN